MDCGYGVTWNVVMLGTRSCGDMIGLCRVWRMRGFSADGMETLIRGVFVRGIYRGLVYSTYSVG